MTRHTKLFHINLNGARDAQSLNYTKSKADVIEQKLLAMIKSGELPPGQWLKQKELADILNTSITPLREALRKLEVRGLVINIPYRGVRVSENPPGEVKQIYLVHAILQSEAVRLHGPTMTDQEIAEAQKLNDRMKAILEKSGKSQAAKLNDLNQEMHLILCGESHFAFLCRLIRFLWWGDVFRVLPNRAETSVQEHERILEALGHRDFEKAAELVKEHFLGLAQALTTSQGLII